MKSNKAFTLIELLVVVFIFIIIGGLLFGAVKGCGAGNYSEGGRVGIVTKFSVKGSMNKSGEGYLNEMAGYQVASQWAFSVTDPNVIQKIERAKRSGKRVELRYKQLRIKGFNTDTDYIVQDVFFLDDNGNIIPEPGTQG